MAIDKHDQEVVRCPRMGDFVPFKYCRGAGRPFCFALIACWAPRLDIGGFLAGHYEPEVIQEALERKPGGRVSKIMETVQGLGKNSGE